MRSVEYKKIALFVSILSLAVILPWGIQQWTAQKHPIAKLSLPSGTVLDRSRAVEAFHLITDENTPFTQQNLIGKWSFAFFGYAACPSICPRSLALFSEMWWAFPEKRPHPQAQFLFISLDPNKDKPENLHRFVKQFHPEFTGLTGDLKTIQHLSKSLGIYSLSSEGELDHSATLLLFSPDGRLRALFSPPHDPHQLMRDIQTLMLAS